MNAYPRSREERRDVTGEQVLRGMRDGRPHFVYELAAAIGMPPVTLYPILARLERAGLTCSGWGVGGDPVLRRRLYRLTAQGLRDVTGETT